MWQVGDFVAWHRRGDLFFLGQSGTSPVVCEVNTIQNVFFFWLSGGSQPWCEAFTVVLLEGRTQRRTCGTQLGVTQHNLKDDDGGQAC